MLAAYWRKDNHEVQELAKLFVSKEEARYSCISLIATTFGNSDLEEVWKIFPALKPIAERVAQIQD